MTCSLSDFLQVAFEYICNEMRSDIYAFFFSFYFDCVFEIYRKNGETPESHIVPRESGFYEERGKGGDKGKL